MFAPNHYESFCSALDKNVNCVGLLLVSAPLGKRSSWNFAVHPFRRHLNTKSHVSGCLHARLTP